MCEAEFGVVLVNWNGCDDTIAALESLLAARPRPTRVVVVDNGSTDDSMSRLRAWNDAHLITWTQASIPVSGSLADAWLVLVEARANLGFSGGNNVGLRYLAERTSCSHFLLLNNDATIAPDYFVRMADALREVPDAALVGCTIYRHPERDQVWFAGGYEIPSRALVLHRYSIPSSDAMVETPFVTGCAMLIARALYEAEGGLADVYNPIYWEDADYSFRARTGGWKVVLAPRAVVYHRVGSSAGGERLTPRVAYMQNRNRGIYVRRNYRGLQRWVALGYLAITKPGRAVVEICRGRMSLASAIFRGFLRGLIAPTT